MDTRLLSIVGLLLVIFIGAMLANSGVVGYSSVKSLNEYPYEGFAQMQEKFDARDEKEAFEPMDSPAIKVSGFKGVQSGAYGDEKIIGFMYNNDANPSCKPYGYTNSKGNICMSPEDIKMLTSRGGNALGASDQIGK
jgi:hypothetical protein